MLGLGLPHIVFWGHSSTYNNMHPFMSVTKIVRDVYVYVHCGPSARSSSLFFTFQADTSRDSQYFSGNNYKPGTIYFLSIFYVLNTIQWYSIDTILWRNGGTERSINSPTSHDKEREADQIYFVGTDLFKPSTLSMEALSIVLEPVPSRAQLAEITTMCRSPIALDF